MIIGSFAPLAVGKRYNQGVVSDAKAIERALPFTVLREASFDEWMAQVKEAGGSLTPAEQIEACALGFFYDVTVES